MYVQEARSKTSVKGLVSYPCRKARRFERECMVQIATQLSLGADQYPNFLKGKKMKKRKEVKEKETEEQKNARWAKMKKMAKSFAKQAGIKKEKTEKKQSEKYDY